MLGCVAQWHWLKSQVKHFLQWMQQFQRPFLSFFYLDRYFARGVGMGGGVGEAGAYPSSMLEKTGNTLGRVACSSHGPELSIWGFGTHSVGQHSPTGHLFSNISVYHCPSTLPPLSMTGPNQIKAAAAVLTPFCQCVLGLGHLWSNKL